MSTVAHRQRWKHTEMCMPRVYGQLLWPLSSTDCVCAAGVTSVVKLVTLLESAGRNSVLVQAL